MAGNEELPVHSDAGGPSCLSFHLADFSCLVWPELATLNQGTRIQQQTGTLKFWELLVSCAPVFIRTGYCVVLLWKQFTRSSGSTRSLLLTHTVRLIAAGGKFCWTSPPGTWLAEVRLQAPLAALEGKKIGESHIHCTFLTQKWHRSHFTCITWATADPWLLLGRGLLGSRGEQKEQQGNITCLYYMQLSVTRGFHGLTSLWQLQRENQMRLIDMKELWMSSEEFYKFDGWQYRHLGGLTVP